jgi:hypothetical protein
MRGLAVLIIQISARVFPAPPASLCLSPPLPPRHGTNLSRVFERFVALFPIRVAYPALTLKCTLLISNLTNLFMITLVQLEQVRRISFTYSRIPFRNKRD